jgi:hypothetical protein
VTTYGFRFLTSKVEGKVSMNYGDDKQVLGDNEMTDFDGIDRFFACESFAMRALLLQCVQDLLYLCMHLFYLYSSLLFCACPHFTHVRHVSRVHALFLSVCVLPSVVLASVCFPFPAMRAFLSPVYAPFLPCTPSFHLCMLPCFTLTHFLQHVHTFL